MAILLIIVFISTGLLFAWLGIQSILLGVHALRFDTGLGKEYKVQFARRREELRQRGEVLHRKGEELQRKGEEFQRKVQTK